MLRTMRCVVQRVSEARVLVDGRLTGEVGRGLLALVAVADDDGEAELAWMAAKLARLRIFPDDEGRMNRSVLDVGGGVLSVSQFTLYGDVRKGTRPSFVGAGHPDHAEPAWERFNELLAAEGVPVATGRFGAMMRVELVNDGPVTLVIDREPR